MNNYAYHALRNAGHIKRLHTVQTVGAHTLQRHVYGAQVLALVLLDGRPRANRGAVLETLLLHDAPEVYTGDCPAPVKRKSPLLNAAYRALEADWYQEYDIRMPVLTKLEEDIVKACDYLDLGWACVEERRLGNIGAPLESVIINVMTYLHEVDVPGLSSLVYDLSNAWRLTNVR